MLLQLQLQLQLLLLLLLLLLLPLLRPLRFALARKSAASDQSEGCQSVRRCFCSEREIQCA